jgi:hypothetical protein
MHNPWSNESQNIFCISASETREFAAAINPLRAGLHSWAAVPVRYRGYPQHGSISKTSEHDVAPVHHNSPIDNQPNIDHSDVE